MQFLSAFIVCAFGATGFAYLAMFMPGLVVRRACEAVWRKPRWADASFAGSATITGLFVAIWVLWPLVDSGPFRLSAALLPSLVGGVAAGYVASTHPITPLAVPLVSTPLASVMLWCCL